MCASNYKLIASDIDGTLLNGKSQLTDEVKNAVKSAVQKGIVFTPSSGRPLRALTWLSDIIQVDTPFITFNGAVVIMSKSNKVILRQAVSAELAQAVCVLGKERKQETVFWSDDELYVTALNDDIKSYQEISGAPINIIKDFSIFEKIGIAKLLWIAEPEKNIRYQLEMSELFAGKLNVHTSRPVFLEFVDANASKALAMQALCDYYKIDKSQTIAIGDGYNDLSMLKFAGLGVAMGNAPQEIKNQCGYVAPTNDQDGVAHVIQKFCL